MSLIRKPKPENWPDHATPMPPMPQVSDADAKKIAMYIKSLETVK
jgi:cytochrome c1